MKVTMFRTNGYLQLCVKFIVFILFIFYCDCAITVENDCEVKNSEAICNNITNFTSLTDNTITKLIVNSKELKTINKKDIVPFKNLEVIDLSNSGITSIDSDAFEELINLEELTLSNMTEFKIPNKKPFILSNSLKKLNLSDVTMDNLNLQIGTDLPNLEVIDLSSTGLKDFSGIKDLKNLKTLYISKHNNSDSLQLCKELVVHQIIEKAEDGTEVTVNCHEDSKPLKIQDELNTNDSITITENATENTSESVATANETESSSDLSATPIKLPIEENSSNSTNSTETKIEIADESKTNKTEILEETSNTNITKNKVENVEVSSTPTIAIEPTSAENISKLDDGKHEEKNVTQTGITNENDTTTEKSSTDINEYVILNETDQKPSNVTIKINSVENNTKPTEKLNNNKINDETNDTNVNKDVEAPPPVQETQNKTHDNFRLQNESDASEKEDEPSSVITSKKEGHVLGVHIILGLTVCVILVGAVGFGFKYYWRNYRRGYRHANTNENPEEGKELQTIVAHQVEQDEN